MLTKVALSIIFVIVAVNCRTFQKNGVTYNVNGAQFVVDGANIPVLRQGLITDIQEMQFLYLTHDNINTIEPGAFGNLPNLKGLTIMYNNIQRIEVGVFNSLTITSLCISINGLEYIASHAFDNMTYLAVIDIASNKLKKWDTQWFAKTPSITLFLLQDNLFTEIQADAFGEQKRTKDFIHINFNGNPINQVDDDAFKNFGVVKHLEININSIDALEGNFLRATHFNQVDIRIDNIKCLDEKYFSKIFVADITRLMSHDFDISCKNKINAWANSHQKQVTVDIV